MLLWPNHSKDTGLTVRSICDWLLSEYTSHARSHLLCACVSDHKCVLASTTSRLTSMTSSNDSLANRSTQLASQCRQKRSEPGKVLPKGTTSTDMALPKVVEGQHSAAASLQHRKMTDKPSMPQIYIACMLTHCAYAVPAWQCAAGLATVPHCQAGTLEHASCGRAAGYTVIEGYKTRLRQQLEKASPDHTVQQRLSLETSMAHAVSQAHSHSCPEVHEHGGKHHAHACQQGQDDKANVGPRLLLCKAQQHVRQPCDVRMSDRQHSIREHFSTTLREVAPDASACLDDTGPVLVQD